MVPAEGSVDVIEMRLVMVKHNIVLYYGAIPEWDLIGNKCFDGPMPLRFLLTLNIKIKIEKQINKTHLFFFLFCIFRYEWSELSIYSTSLEVVIEVFGQVPFEVLDLIVLSMWR